MGPPSCKQYAALDDTLPGVCSRLPRDPGTRYSAQMLRVTLIALEILIGVAALGGGAYAFAGARDVPREWLRNTPFRSYAIPGVILVVAVGGSMLGAAGLLIAEAGVARLVSLEAGIVLLAWVAMQVALIGYRSWLQPVMGVLGAVVVVLSFLLPSPG